MIRLVLSDMDNTLIPFGADHVSDRTARAIHELLDAGVPFGPATGRDYVELMRFFRGDEACFMTGILSNGKRVRAEGRYVRTVLLGHDELVRIDEALRGERGMFLVCYPNETDASNPAYCVRATKEESAPFERRSAFTGICVDAVPDEDMIAATIACPGPPERMDRVSTMGYGLGYIGGSTIPLVIFLLMNLAGVPMLTCLAVIFAITAVWWLVFSLPLLKNCRQTSGKPYEKGDVGRSLRGVGATVREIIANKPMLVYILAYFFYIDGVHTVISMATTYGTNLGLDDTGMMLALLLVQILGLPFCLLYIRLAARFGARAMVGVGVCVYMFICVFAFFMRELWQFWLLAVLCATSQGGIQALSRSMFGKLLPDKDRSGEFFGFFDIFGKFSSIMGPALVGFVSALVADRMLAEQGLTEATATAEQVDAINAASGPYGILSVLLIILVGAVLYFFVLPKTLADKK